MKLPQPVLYEPDAVPLVCVAAGDADGGHALAALAVPVWEQAAPPGCSDDAGGAAVQQLLAARPDLASLDSQAAGGLRGAAEAQLFSGKRGQVLPPVLLAQADGERKPWVLLVGLGKAPQQQQQQQQAPQWGRSCFHEAGASLAATAKSHRLTSLHVQLAPVLGGADGADGDAAAAAVTGLVLGVLNHLYEVGVRYRSKPQPKAVLQALVLQVPPQLQAAAEAAAVRATALARGTLMARFLTEAPANVCTPAHLAAAARHIVALDPQRFSLQVLDAAACAALGMGLYLGVAQGSDEAPLFVHLTYRGPLSLGAAPARIALVGKGLTFDSGGYNLKVKGGIETMHVDMGGAGAVLGAARALAELRPAGVEVHFITAACENMVSGRATRPGDILVSAKGLTVEVNDTDAEGRLTLADALWYAQAKAGAKTVVDAATLTGAAGVALGQETGALFSNDEALAAQLQSASSTAGEKLWRMPLDEGLRSKLDSVIADLKNYPGPWGGAITAGLFLQQFIEPGTAWAHLDIAGPAWVDTGFPTGFGAATLAEWVARLAAPQQQAAAE